MAIAQEHQVCRNQINQNTHLGITDSVATFRSSPDAPTWGDIQVSNTK